MNGPRRHPPFSYLADYVERRLPETEAARVEAHLADGCQTCQEQVDWLTNTLALMLEDRWEAPPAAVRQTVLDAFGERRGKRNNPVARPGVWERLAALFQGGLSPAAVAFAALVFVVAGLLLFYRGLPRNGEVALASVTAVNGPVEVLLPDASSWQTAQAGISLPAGSQLRSGAEGTASLSYFEGSITKVYPDTRFTVATLEGDDGGEVIALTQDNGQLFHVVSPAESGATKFVVDAASVNVRVHGTRFLTGVSDEGLVVVAVTEGEVEARSADTSVFVSAGRMTSVTPGAAPGPTVMIPAGINVEQGLEELLPTVAITPGATGTPTLSVTATSLTMTPSAPDTPTPSLTPTGATMTPSASATPSPSLTPTGATMTPPGLTMTPPGPTMTPPGPPCADPPCGDPPGQTMTPDPPGPPCGDPPCGGDPPGQTMTPDPPGPPCGDPPCGGDPPGLTMTPEPPGQTMTPEPPGQTMTPEPPGQTMTPEPPGQSRTPGPPCSDPPCGGGNEGNSRDPKERRRR